MKRWAEEYGIDKSEADEWYNYLCSNAINDNFIFSRNFYMVWEQNEKIILVFCPFNRSRIYHIKRLNQLSYNIILINRLAI